MPHNPPFLPAAIETEVSVHTQSNGLIAYAGCRALAWFYSKQQAHDLVRHTLEVETEISDLMTTVQAAESGIAAIFYG